MIWKAVINSVYASYPFKVGTVQFEHNFIFTRTVAFSVLMRKLIAKRFHQ